MVFSFVHIALRSMFLNTCENFTKCQGVFVFNFESSQNHLVDKQIDLKQWFQFSSTSTSNCKKLHSSYQFFAVLWDCVRLFSSSHFRFRAKLKFSELHLMKMLNTSEWQTYQCSAFEFPISTRWHFGIKQFSFSFSFSPDEQKKNSGVWLTFFVWVEWNFPFSFLLLHFIFESEQRCSLPRVFIPHCHIFLLSLCSRTEWRIISCLAHNQCLCCSLFVPVWVSHFALRLQSIFIDFKMKTCHEKLKTNFPGIFFLPNRVTVFILIYDADVSRQFQF